MSMSSSKSYLIKALFDWILDNQCTPHIVVNAAAKNVQVPEQYVNKNGEIILNIAPGAVEHFHMDKDSIQFHARFGGISQSIYVPMFAIQGIYARENGRGMMFEQEPEQPDPQPPTADDDAGHAAKKPSLRVVK